MLLQIDAGQYVADVVGIWSITWNGNATVSPIMTTATVINQTYIADTNLGSAFINMPSAERNLSLSFDTGNKGITNLVALKPGYTYSNQAFPVSFRDPLLTMETIRFTTFTATTNSTVASWSDRNTMDTAQYTNGKGAPWEVVIALINQIGSDIWLNIPHMATDEYVIQLALLMNSTLNNASNIYIEYSDQLWNPNYTQYSYNRDQATYMVNNGYGSVLNYDGVNSLDVWAVRRIALKTKMIGDIFRYIYGNSCDSRIRPVFAYQFTNPEPMHDAMEMIDAVYGSPSKYFYGIAGSSHASLGAYNAWTNLTGDGILTVLANSSANLPVDNNYIINTAYAKYYQLALLTYAGGPDTSGPNMLASKKNASLSDNMKYVVEKILRDWYSYNGILFVWDRFTATNYDIADGTWGLTNDALNYNKSPKWIGMRNITTPAPPKITIGNIVPGTVFGGNDIYVSNNGGAWKNMKYGDKVFYLINCLNQYSIIFNVTLYYSTNDTGASINVYINDQLLAANYSLTYPASNSSTNAFQFTIGRLGVLAIESLATKSSFEIQSLLVTKIAGLPYGLNETCVPEQIQITTTTGTSTGASTTIGSSTTGVSTTGPVTSTTGSQSDTSVSAASALIHNVSIIGLAIMLLLK